MLLLFLTFGLVEAQRGLFPANDVKLPGAVQLNPAFIDFAYEPEIQKAPGIDFLGWGYDATYRDQFFSLKPSMFLFSYNNNPKGKERIFQYPLDTKQYAIPDQVYIRTVGKTDSSTLISDNLNINRMKLDLALGITASTAQLEGSIKLGLNLLMEKTGKHRVVTCFAETELYQLYLGKKFLSADAIWDMDQLNGLAFSKDKPQNFVQFLSTWGTHYVDSVSVGGSVKQQSSFNYDNDTMAMHIGIAIAGKFAAGSGAKVSLELSIDIEMANIAVRTSTTANAIVVGGDAKFSEFLLHSDNPMGAAQLFESWKSTLMKNPAAVRFRLIETWQLFSTLRANPGMAYQVCQATSFFLQFKAENAAYCDGVPAVISSSVREGGLARGKPTTSME